MCIIMDENSIKQYLATSLEINNGLRFKFKGLKVYDVNKTSQVTDKT